MPRSAGEAARTAPSAGFSLDGPGTSLRVLLRELWQSRRLVAVLARKDFLVRYRRTRLGLVWAVGLPLVQAVVVAVVFSQVVGRFGDLTGSGDRDATPYAVYVLAGMVPWAYFSAAFTAGSTAVVDGADLAQRIYFPRLVLPLVAVATALYPLAATLAVLLAVVLVLGPGLQLALLWLVPGTALVVLLVLGLSLFFSAAQVYVRDLRFAVGAGLTVLFYMTPVIYPIDRLPSGLAHLFRLLPATGPVELYHRAVSASGPHLWRSVAASLVWTVVAGGLGLWLHCRRDRVLADAL